MMNASHEIASSARTPSRAIADKDLLHLLSDGERLRQQGFQAGIIEGLTQALLSLYESNHGQPPEALQQSLRHSDDPSRLIELLPVFLHSDADSISRAVLL